MGTEREEIKRITEVKLFGLTETELKAIAMKYNLEYRDYKSTCWVTLKISEADTEITWFKA